MEIIQRIKKIADTVEELADEFSEHPDRVARVHSVMMSVDAEIFERMSNIRKEYEA